jgi:hypothetical protein
MRHHLICIVVRILCTLLGFEAATLAELYPVTSGHDAASSLAIDAPPVDGRWLPMLYPTVRPLLSICSLSLPLLGSGGSGRTTA